MKAKRFFAAALMVLMVLGLFGACGKKENTSSGSASSGPDASELVNSYINTADVSFLDADGEATYRVVRPEEAASEVSLLGSLVFKTYKAQYNVSPANVTDSEEKNDRAEILIGKTNRDSTAKALQILNAEGSGRADEYIICTIGKDIVIVGSSDESTIAAANYFCDNYLKQNPVSGGINYFFSDPNAYKPLTIFGLNHLSSIKVVRPIYNVSYLTQNETNSLLDAILKNNGYALELQKDQVASNTGNKTDGSGTLTVTDAAEYEIIIGNCKRDGVNIISDPDKYEIRIEDKKIFLNGGSAHATALAVSEFTKIISANTEITPALSVASGSYDEVIKSYDSASTYKWVWGDYFDGTSINESIWDVRWDEGTNYPTDATGRSPMRGSSKLKNNYVKDGCFYIAAEMDTEHYYGGRITTDTMMQYLYGYLEISDIHPKGVGMWTSLWGVSVLHSGTGPITDKNVIYGSETDVEECYGDGTWVYGNTFAWPTAYGKTQLGIPADKTGAVHVNNARHSDDDRGFWMDFHTFGYEWVDQTRVRFTCDGEAYVDQELREGAEQLAYSQPTYMQISMVFGSSNQGLTTDEKELTETNKFITDWIALYQKTGQTMWQTSRKNAMDWKITHS